ncbi:hypothetical protein Aspvir_001790 [Aspergillus viridinutans]|uniref:Ecp2 effector protein-like domain-containing protein n=1 Tax=Aspergillus viridinutans TaxID=75553 RepID=A0A9P3F5A0_ASPVI|nr:uncharacterized protein Aspvir_001790 [Aspergillus viridinutans]GIK06147.1 hypothetical protein Aspvir_001790 [Aspergillus viridinutans]
MACAVAGEGHAVCPPVLGAVAVFEGPVKLEVSLRVEMAGALIQKVRVTVGVIDGRQMEKVRDCMQIEKNIQNTDGDWEVENAIGNRHQLVQFGSCAFGVQSQGKNGNIDFNFGGSRKVGAKGVMSCDGTAKGQQVEWGLY